MTPQNGISLLNKPTNTIFTFPQLKLCSRCLAFPPSEFLCLGKHFPRKLVSFKNRAGNPCTMKEPIKTRIYRERNGDECVMGLEQEAFIDGSSEFRPIARANGFESTLNRLSKWLVAIFFAAAILWRHDAEAMWAALGCTLNAGLSNMLKRILNQERPLSTSKSDPGMPSSHAQSIFFTTMFANFSYIPTSYSYWGASLVLYHLTLPKVQHMESYSWAMLLLLKIPASYSCWGASVMLYLRNSLRVVELLGVNVFTTTIIGIIFALGSYLTWLRVSLQFHTISQVAVGAAVGSIFSILWFWSWNAIVFDAYYSYLWVRIIVVLGAAGYSLAFLLFIIRYWVMESIVNFVSMQIKNL